MSITSEQVVASETFRALNLMIDRAVVEAVGYANMTVDAVRLQTDYVDDISTRTYDEGAAKVDLPISRERLRRIRDLADDAIAAIKRVEEIQRFKLRLLNDYDFTRGDDTDQRAVFADQVPQ